MKDWISNAHQFDAARFIEMAELNGVAVTSVAERLAAKQAAKEVREAARKAAADAQLLAELELEEKLINEGKGDRGVDFEIVNTEIGLFAVSKPEFLVAKKFNSIAADKVSEEDIIAYVAPCIIGDSMAFRTAVAAHAGIASRLCIALRLMYEARRVDQLGKL